MDRRKFVSLSAVGIAGAGVLSGVVTPIEVVASAPSMAGGVYLTKDSPGRWAKKIGGHMPEISAVGDAASREVKVLTAHGMQGYEHYIVKHIILDADFNYLDERMFDPEKDKAASSLFTVKNYSGRIHCLSVCNKHDTWMNFVDV